MGALLPTQYRGATATVAAAPNPTVFGHRGFANLYPENLLPGFVAACDQRVPGVETDCRILTDNTLGVMHDATIDRLTTSSGNVSAQSSSSWKQLVADASSWFLPSASDSAPALFSEVLTKVARRAIVLCESKIAGSMAKMVAALDAAGYANSAIVYAAKGSLTSEVNVGIAAGYPSMQLYSGDFTSAADALTDCPGLAWVGLSLAETTQEVVDDCQANGLKVLVYTVDRQSDFATVTGYGVDAIVSNDPVYVSGLAPRLTADQFSSATYMHGQIASSGSVSAPWTNRGFYSSGRLLLNWSGRTWILLGQMCPVANPAGSYSVTFTVTNDQPASPADTGRSAGVCVCAPDDRLYDNAHAGRGYRVSLSEAGNLFVRRQDDATETSTLGQQSTTAWGQGATATIKVDVSPTQIKATRTDSGGFSAVTVNDTTYRGGYIHVGKDDQSKNAHYSFSGLAVN